MSIDKGEYKIKKFDGKDFSNWKLRTENALRHYKCWVAVELEDYDVTEEAKAEIDENARFIIMGSVSDQVLRKVKGNITFEIWSNLLKKYEEKNAQGINFLRRKFLNVKQEKSEPID